VTVGKRESSHAKLRKAWGDDALLERMLLDGSGLPGPRGNLELAAAFADVLAEHVGDADAWALVLRWSSLDALQAPVQDRREYLPFCATVALGAMHRDADGAGRKTIRARLTDAAQDPRWRMREAAAMAVQRLGLSDFAAAAELVESWVATHDPVLMRAALAALADRPLLAGEGRPEIALAVAERAFELFAGAGPEERKAEPWRVLRKGLEYAPSVFVALAPDAGFALLRGFADHRDVEVRKVVAANLRKTRIARSFPEQAESVAQALAWADDAFTDL